MIFIKVAKVILQSLKGTVSRDGGRDGPVEQWPRPILVFVNTFFRFKDTVFPCPFLAV
jgi:hypothetical protein